MFVTQLHIIALIATVFQHNYDEKLGFTRPRQETVPPYHLCIVQPVHWAYPETDFSLSQTSLDFSFMPELLAETNLDFAAMQAIDRRLLETDLFSRERLLKEIAIGVEYGFDANMP
jgi:hypothetical protein